MSFQEAILTCLNKYADFNGRARRSEYWYFWLLNFLVSGVLGYLGNKVGTVFTVISSLYSLAVLVPGLAVCWRRLHDTGRSGAKFFFVLIPLVGAILLLVWCTQDSQRGANQYGPDPKGYDEPAYSGSANDKQPWEY